MPVTFSIKTVPDRLAGQLRARARRNHRSLQGELMSILEDAVGGRPFDARALLERARMRGLASGDESAGDVRATRDGR